MSNFVNYLTKTFYSGRTGWKNGSEEFHELLREYICPNQATVLEVGAGPTNMSSNFVGDVSLSLDGIDIDARVTENKALRRAYLYDGLKFPLSMPDAEYDVVFCDYVLEHVEFPELVFTEIRRVLKPGGYFIFRTPNLAHYVSLIARSTPHSFHLLVAHRSRGRSVEELEPYPTFFRCNTRGAVKKVASKASFAVVNIDFVEKEPSYLQFNAIAFLFGVFYERLVNSIRFLKIFRANIFCVLRAS